MAARPFSQLDLGELVPGLHPGDPHARGTAREGTGAGGSRLAGAAGRGRGRGAVGGVGALSLDSGRAPGAERSLRRAAPSAPSAAAAAAAAAATMPNFAGTWKMRSSENFDELLKALGKRARMLPLECAPSPQRVGFGDRHPFRRKSPGLDPRRGLHSRARVPRGFGWGSDKVFPRRLHLSLLERWFLGSEEGQGLEIWGVGLKPGPATDSMGLPATATRSLALSEFLLWKMELRGGGVGGLQDAERPPLPAEAPTCRQAEGVGCPSPATPARGAHASPQV